MLHFCLLWQINSTFSLKEILHPKMKMLSSFTSHQVVANLYGFLSSAEHEGRYFEERLKPNSCLAPLTSIVEKKKYYGSQWCQNSNRSSRYLPLCSAEERNSNKFATTWGWLNDDSIFIFWVEDPFKWSSRHIHNGTDSNSCWSNCICTFIML